MHNREVKSIHPHASFPKDKYMGYVSGWGWMANSYSISWRT